jgi:LPXTG-motif cell wall-anchored protein
MDCDTLTFGLDNPADGEEVKLTLTTSKGETRKLVVKPGEQKVEKFSATPGFVLTVKDDASGESVQLPYTQPADCAPGGGAGEPELPLTGAAAGGIAGGAALLLGAGGVLFFMARRRKVKFTV